MKEKTLLRKLEQAWMMEKEIVRNVSSPEEPNGFLVLKHQSRAEAFRQAISLFHECETTPRVKITENALAGKYAQIRNIRNRFDGNRFRG